MGWDTLLLRFALHAGAAALLVAAVLSSRGRSAVGDLLLRLERFGARRATLAVVAAAVLVRLALLPAFEPVPEADVAEYVEKAEAIAEEGHPRRVETRHDGTRFYRTLGWSLPLAGWYRLTGTRGIRSAQVLGVLVAGLVTWLLVELGAALGSRRAGLLAAAGYALFLPAAIFSVVPYSETWAALCVVVAALAYLRTRDSSGPARLPWALLLGLSEGLLVITRTELLFLPPLTLVLLLLESRDRARALLPAGLFLLAALLPLAVNHELRAGYPGHLRTSVQGGLILYFGNNPIEVNGHGNATPEVAARVQALYAADRTGGLARDAALRWMREHPLAVLANAPKKLFHLWLAEPQGFGWHVQAGQPQGMPRWLSSPLRHLAWVQALALLALGAAGLVRSWRPAFRLWLALLVGHAAVWALLAASTRNRYPLEPLLLLTAALLLTRVPPLTTVPRQFVNPSTTAPRRANPSAPATTTEPPPPDHR